MPVEIWRDKEFIAEWHNRISALKSKLAEETQEVVDAVYSFKMQ